MRKVNAVAILFIMIIYACQTKTKQEEVKIPALNKADIDFFVGSTPISFSAKTTDGTIFNSNNNKGKYWVVFAYDKDYLKKSDTYDMVAELNATQQKFKDQVSFVGIISGFIENEKELKDLLKGAKLNFKQIDNTKSYKKEEVLKNNIFCGPAKIIINPEGKVIYNGCGGKTQTLDFKLDSIINGNKSR